MNYNMICIGGRLTRDVELSYTPNQTAVAKFGLAANKKWRGKDGTEREDVLFVDCVAFGKSAETLNQYLSKGDPLFVQGRLTLDTWTTPEGTKRSKHYVTIDNFQFIGGPKKEGFDEPSPSARTVGQPNPNYNPGPGDEEFPF